MKPDFANRFCRAKVLWPRRGPLAGRCVGDRRTCHFVGRLLFTLLLGGFAVHLSASEPASSPTNVAPPAAAANQQAAKAHTKHTLSESELRQLLTAKLQHDYVQNRGQLELSFSQPWKPIQVPSGPLTLRILDLPSMGVTAYFIVRFEVRTASRSLGTFQLPVQAHVWRKVWVAKSPLSRGESLADADIAKERRDVLKFHQPLAAFPPGDSALELTRSLQAGAVLLARSVQLRPVVHRGQTVDAMLQDGALTITIKVQVLQDGAPGQIVRARNMSSQRDIRGKVLNGQTILVSL